MKRILLCPKQKQQVEVDGNCLVNGKNCEYLDKFHYENYVGIVNCSYPHKRKKEERDGNE